MRRLLAIALALTAVAASCGDDDDTSSPTTLTTSSTSTTVIGPRTTEPDQPPALVDPADTARAWMAAIAGGDDEGAIALTAPRSLAAVGGAAGFREREIELAEGWGAWDTAPSIEVEVVEVGGAGIVVLHGEIAQEGPPRETWDALAVVATDDGDRVEPFLDLGNVEVDPAADTVIPPSTTLTAYVLGDRDVWFVIDGDRRLDPELEGFDGDRQKATAPVSDLAPGLHALTVVLANDDGVMARTFLYRVEA